MGREGEGCSLMHLTWGEVTRPCFIGTEQQQQGNWSVACRLHTTYSRTSLYTLSTGISHCVVSWTRMNIWTKQTTSDKRGHNISTTNLNVRSRQEERDHSGVAHAPNPPRTRRPVTRPLLARTRRKFVHAFATSSRLLRLNRHIVDVTVVAVRHHLAAASNNNDCALQLRHLSLALSLSLSAVD